MTYHTKPHAFVNIYSFPLFIPFSHLTLRIIQEAFNTMYCPGKKHCGFNSFSISVLTRCSADTCCHSPLSLSQHYSHTYSYVLVCQLGSPTKLSVLLLQLYLLKSGTKHRPMIFLHRMSVHCVGGIQLQEYKI